MCETRGGGEGLWPRLPATGPMLCIVIRALYGSLIVQRGEGMTGAPAQPKQLKHANCVHAPDFLVRLRTV